MSNCTFEIEGQRCRLKAGHDGGHGIDQAAVIRTRLRRAPDCSCSSPERFADSLAPTGMRCRRCSGNVHAP